MTISAGGVGSISAQAVTDRDVLRLEREPGSFGLEQKELRKVFLRHAVSDQCLYDVTRGRRERHRYLESAPGVQTEVEILAQEFRREGHLEVEVDERGRLVARESRAHHAL